MDTCCKVGRLIEGYSLDQSIGGQPLDEYLLARWLGRDDYTSTGLRPLKDWFNKRLLKREYTENGRPISDSRIASDYDALAGDETDLALLDTLTAEGIDGEQLQADFVSTATLYRHFTQCLEASKSDASSQSDSNWESDKIDFAKGVVESNVRDSLRALENKGALPRGTDAEIKTEIVLGCPECSTQVGVERAIERGYICATHTDRASDEQTDLAQSDN